MLHPSESHIHPQDLIGALKTRQKDGETLVSNQRDDKSFRSVAHLKDGQDAAVPKVALILVVLSVSQTSENLESLAGTQPAPLRAEDLRTGHTR